MIQPSDIFTLTDFKRMSSELIDKLETSGRPQVLTVEGAPKVVVMGVAEFERLAELAERADSIAKIRQGLEDVKAGRSTALSEVFEELRRKTEGPRDA